MNVADFIRDVPSASPAPIYLFCPAKAPRARDATFEPFLADRAIEHFIEAAVDPAAKDLVFATYYADETVPEAIVVDAQTLPFLAERRVILVRNAERYNAESAAGPLLAYLDDPNESTVMLLVTNRADKRTKFYKACTKNGVVVECAALAEREVTQWIEAETQALGRAIERNAVREIVLRVGTHLSDVNNALTLVINFIGESEAPITEEHVTAACADVAEEEIWALTDAIAASQAGEALNALRKLLDLGKHPDEIVGTINWLLKSAYAVAIAPGEPAISRFVAKKVGPLAGKLGIGKLRAAFALCTDTQFMTRSTGVDGALALELLVVKLAAPRPRGA